MAIFTYLLIGLYAVLTGLAGIIQWKEAGFRLPVFSFVIVSISIVGILFIPNKDWLFRLLIFTFVLYHVLAVIEGLFSNGRLKISHHFIRFVFHCIMILLVYKFIK
jgi:hypothetical protein